MDQVEGVVETRTGYTGGLAAQPTYGSVQSRKSGHVECVELTFSDDLSPEDLSLATESALEAYLSAIDATDGAGQGANRGPQYRPAVFFRSPSQRRAAERALGAESQRRSGARLAVRVRRAQKFWPAEEVHQRYHEKNGGLVDPTNETPFWMGAFLE